MIQLALAFTVTVVEPLQLHRCTFGSFNARSCGSQTKVRKGRAVVKAVTEGTQESKKILDSALKDFREQLLKHTTDGRRLAFVEAKEDVINMARQTLQRLLPDAWDSSGCEMEDCLVQTGQMTCHECLRLVLNYPYSKILSPNPYSTILNLFFSKQNATGRLTESDLKTKQQQHPWALDIELNNCLLKKTTVTL